MTATPMTEIYFNNLGTGALVRIEVPTSEAEDAIDWIRRADNLDFSAAYPMDY